jgi:methylthioribulose-1-phosphate dehydratase
MALVSRPRSSRGRFPRSSASARRQLCEMLRLFYAKGWVSGTGGGICSRISGSEFLLAPSGVHKESIRPRDFFVIRVRDGHILRPPLDSSLRPSECNAVFRAIIKERDAGSVAHSHALSAVLAADAARGDALAIRGFEMLKGIRGCSNREVHRVPVIDNTREEPALAAAVGRVLRRRPFASAHCVLVRDHGAYLWGADVSEAKRHAEVYHFLFEGVLARREFGRVRR